MSSQPCPKCGASSAPGAKFCGACGAALVSAELPAAVFCSECGAKNDSAARFCKSCGKALAGGAGGAAVAQPGNVGSLGEASASSNKVAAGICGILLGGLGVHKFILGYRRAGVIMLSATLCCFFAGILTCGLTWFATPAMWAIGLVEGIIYLTRSDEDFVRIYVDGRKEWF